MKSILVASLSVIIFLVSTISNAKVSQEIKAAVASKDRPSSETSRDANRKPGEVLALLGIKSGMRVMDLTAGTGYYSDMISKVVGDKGRVYSHNPPYVINRFPEFLNDPKQGWLPRFESQQWQSNVSKKVGELDTMSFPLQLDAAIMVLFYHDVVWQGVNREMMNQHIFNSLKKGGSFLVIDHSGKKGSGLKDVKTLHRIDKQTVIEDMLKVGFKLDVDSNLLSHPEDTRDYPFFRDSATKRDQTDRMVLKFVKPAK